MKKRITLFLAMIMGIIPVLKAEEETAFNLEAQQTEEEPAPLYRSIYAEPPTLSASHTTAASSRVPLSATGPEYPTSQDQATISTVQTICKGLQYPWNSTAFSANEKVNSKWPSALT